MGTKEYVRGKRASMRKQWRSANVEKVIPSKVPGDDQSVRFPPLPLYVGVDCDRLLEDGWRYFKRRNDRRRAAFRQSGRDNSDDALSR
jgi:hypothetical protein